MNTIQDQWQTFLALVVPADAPDVQKVEMRKAFYAGAESMCRINWQIGDLSENDAMEVLNNIHEEIQTFANSISKAKN